MLLEASDVQRDSVLHADVLDHRRGRGRHHARPRARGNARHHLLLESGGLDGDDATQALAHGLSSKTEYPVDVTRLRYFGGTTNHWGGWCRPMDAWVFEHRPWVTDVGWPIGPDDLADYYRRAARSRRATDRSRSAGRGTGRTGASNSRSGATRRCPRTTSPPGRCSDSVRRPASARRIATSCATPAT